MVVDFSSHVNDARDFSYINMPLRDEGWAMLENILEKMQACGISDLIIAPSKWKDWSAYGGDESFPRLFKLANKHGMKSKRLVFDAEYLSWQEVAQDLE